MFISQEDGVYLSRDGWLCWPEASGGGIYSLRGVPPPSLQDWSRLKNLTDCDWRKKRRVWNKKCLLLDWGIDMFLHSFMNLSLLLLLACTVWASAFGSTCLGFFKWWHIVLTYQIPVFSLNWTKGDNAALLKNGDAILCVEISIFPFTSRWGRNVVNGGRWWWKGDML